MPKSRRQKLLSLTKTSKKGRAAKEKLIEEVRDACDLYSDVYVMAMKNPRNQAMKEVRSFWAGSRIFQGKNKLLALALGLEESSEHKTNLHKVAQCVTGDRFLFFTSSEKDHVLQYFQDFKEENFARSGFVSTKDFAIPAGALPQFSFALEPQLRQLGLPTRLVEGVIELEAHVTVCRRGDVLSPEQCKILELFGQQLAHTYFKVYGRWSNDTYEHLDDDEEEDDNGDDDFDGDAKKGRGADHGDEEIDNGDVEMIGVGQKSSTRSGTGRKSEKKTISSKKKGKKKKKGDSFMQPDGAGLLDD